MIDPFLGGRHTQPSLAGRGLNPLVDLPVSIDRVLAGVDYVIVSHLHPDHFDEEAQRSIPRQLPLLCQPGDVDALKAMDFATVLGIGRQLEVGGVIITRTACQHGSGDILRLMGEASGFVFQHDLEKTLYWCGDTVWYEDVQAVIDRADPRVIVCHAGGNRFVESHNLFGPAFAGDSDPLVMDTQQVGELLDYVSQTQVVATHIGALDHDSVTRQELLDSHKCWVEEGAFFVPQDGSELVF